MAYYGNTNSSSPYYVPSAYDELNAYPFLGRTLASQQLNWGTFTDQWAIDEQANYMTSSAWNLQRGTSLNHTASSATLRSAGTQEYDHLAFSQPHWSTDSLHAKPGGYNLSKDNSLMNAIPVLVSSVAEISSGVPLDHRRDNGSGPSTNAFQMDVQTPYRPSTHVGETGLMETWGPVTPKAPHPTPPNPPGGTPEATADAEQNQSTTEEGAIPKSKRAQGTKRVREWRIQHTEDTHTLRSWAQDWKNLKKPPSQERALSIALEVVEKLRAPVYPEQKLAEARYTVRRPAAGKRVADSECARRNRARGANEELSRYFELPKGEREWTTPELLKKGSLLGEVYHLPKPNVPSSSYHQFKI